MLLYDVVPQKYEFGKLDNTISWNSKIDKNNQVSINLIDNSIRDYNQYIENKINEKLDLDIPHIDKIDESYNNVEEYIECRFHIKQDLLKEFKKAFELKYDSESGLSIEITLFIEKFVKEFFNIQHQDTSSFLIFDRKDPRKDVLLKLLKISSEIQEYRSTVFTRRELHQLIEETLGVKDSRTVKKYVNCMIGFSGKMMGQAQNYNGRFNMRGLKEAVLEKLGSKDESKQDNSGEENV